MPKLGESWADLVPAAYYKMVMDLESGQKLKVYYQSTIQFFIDDYLAADADYLKMPQLRFGNYAGSAGYALIWYIGHEFGFDVYRDGRYQHSQWFRNYDWNKWAVQLCDSTGSNIATMDNIPLYQAIQIGVVNILEWEDHPFVDSGSAGKQKRKTETKIHACFESLALKRSRLVQVRATSSKSILHFVQAEL